MPRRPLRPLASLLLLLAIASCDDATGTVPDAAVGLYDLTRVNGQLLPVRIVATAEQQVDITGGRLNVRANGSYRESRDSRITDAAGTRTGTAFTEGTLHVSGATLEMREREGGSYPGTFVDGDISYTIPVGEGGISFTYEKP